MDSPCTVLRISIDRPLLRLPSFWLVMTFSGILGLAISFTSMWFLHQTGATTYSLVGSLNKIPLSIAGIFLFKVPTSVENSASILFELSKSTTTEKLRATFEEFCEVVHVKPNDKTTDQRFVGNIIHWSCWMRLTTYIFGHGVSKID